jgi:hypothetical protein
MAFRLGIGLLLFLVIFVVTALGVQLDEYAWASHNLNKQNYETLFKVLEVVFIVMCTGYLFWEIINFIKHLRSAYRDRE